MNKTVQLHSKQKTVTINCWTYGNDDWTIVTSQDPEKTKNILFNAVPTWIIRPAKGDPYKIERLVMKFAKSFPEYAQDTFALVTKNYFKSYKSGFAWRHDTEDIYDTWENAIECIDKKDYSRFVVDSTYGNGYFYDEKKKPIFKRLFVNLIEMHGRFNYHNPKHLTPEQVYEKLKKHPQVKNLEWTEIPYYNQDNDGIVRVPTFCFESKSEKQFHSMVKMSEGSWELENLIFKRLNILTT